MKLCFVTGMWQRHEVFEMFAEGIVMLRDHFKHVVDIHCCVAGSEGDISKNLASRYGNFHYVETRNQPLGEKMNKALMVARELSPDYCLMVGSDDLIGVNLMRRYLKAMDSKVDFVCLMDCYFFDTRTKKGLYWGGYRKPHNIGKAAGVGKLISKELLDKINWNCFPPGYDRILDTGFEKALSRVSYTKQEIYLSKENLFCLDIKSSTNMTPFAQWDNSNFIDGKELLFNNLPEYLAKKIYG